MKISYYTHLHRNEGDMHLITMLLKIQDGTFAAEVNALRRAKQSGDTTLADKLKKALPAFTLSATYAGRRKNENITCYNGLILLDFDKLPADGIRHLAEQAAALPYTLFCFRSPGGEGLKIGVRPVVSHPVTAANHPKTFRAVTEYYEKHLGVKADPSGKDTGRLCFVSYDEHAYISGLLRGENDKGAESRPDLPPMDDAAISPASPALSSRGVSAALTKARKCTTRKIKYEEGNRNNYVYLFANHCNRLGLHPDDVYAYAQKHFADMPPEEVRAAVSSAYTHASEHHTAPPRRQEKNDRCIREIAGIEEYLLQHYRLRYNIVIHRVEYQKVRSRQPYLPIDDAKENSIWCDLRRLGIDCRQTTLRALLISDFSKPYDPFVAYFSSLPPWDGKVDYIARLADTVQTTRQDLWHICLKKWIVAMVACATLPDVENHTVLMLNSEQGIGKTTWCSRLLPPELAAYRYSGLPNTDSKDNLINLSECILVNFDELGSLSMKEINKLKEIITKSVIRERRAYGRNTENYIRRASFTASVNNHQVLSDLTGSRRFLCFEAKTIDHLTPVDYRNVYSQAVALLKSGFRYWLDSADIEEINDNNDAFRVRTPEEEFFYTYFRKPTPKDTAMQWLTTSQILELVCLKTHLPFTHGGTVKLGMILKKDGFICRKKHKTSTFCVVRITDEEVSNAKEGGKGSPGDDGEDIDSESVLLL